MRRSIGKTVCLWAALALALGWSSSSALAIRDSEKALFGPVGVTAGHILRINVYGIGNPNDAQRSFVIRLFDTRGEVVGERRLQLPPGVTGAADFRVGDGDLVPDRTGRRTLRAEIVGFNPQPDPPSEWFTTLEVINARTGRTTIMIGGPDTMPEPR